MALTELRGESLVSFVQPIIQRHAPAEWNLREIFHRVLQGAAQRGAQFHFIFAALRALFSCSEMSLFSLKTCTPVKATPWSTPWIFRSSHRFWREIFVKFPLGHPNPGKCSTENFTKISRQISRHLQRKTEKKFTSALLHCSCSDLLFVCVCQSKLTEFFCRTHRLWHRTQWVLSSVREVRLPRERSWPRGSPGSFREV